MPYEYKIMKSSWHEKVKYLWTLWSILSIWKIGNSRKSSRYCSFRVRDYDKELVGDQRKMLTRIVIEFWQILGYANSRSFFLVKIWIGKSNIVDLKLVFLFRKYGHECGKWNWCAGFKFWPSLFCSLRNNVSGKCMNPSL